MEGRFREILGFDIKQYGWKVLQGDFYSVLPQSRTIIMSTDYDDHRKDFFSTNHYARMALLTTLPENADTNIKELFKAIYSRVKWDFDIVEGHIVVKQDVAIKQTDVFEVEKDNGQYRVASIGYLPKANELLARSKFVTKSKLECVHLITDDVTVNDAGVILIPRNSFADKKVMQVYMRQDEPYLKEIDICEVQYAKNRDEIIKICLNRKVSLVSGKINIERKEGNLYPWMDHIHTSLDFVKNPLNKGAWEVLPDEPAYVGADLFVTSDERPYVHINGAWIPASREWIRKQPHLPETIAYEYQLYKGVKGST